MQIIPTGFFVAMPGGVFIDTGEGNEWADALLFPPWLPDRGDGTCFYNIAFLSPDARLQCPLQLGEDGGQPLPAFAPDVLGLHSPTDTDEGQQDVI